MAIQLHIITSFKLHIQIIPEYLEKKQHIGFMKPFHAFNNNRKKPKKKEKKIKLL